MLSSGIQNWSQQDMIKWKKLTERKGDQKYLKLNENSGLQILKSKYKITKQEMKLS